MSKPSKTKKQPKSNRAVDTEEAKPVAAKPKKWYQRPLLLSLVSGLLLYASFPPLGWWPLCWLAAAPLLLLVAKPDALAVRRPYLQIWLGGVLHWALLLFFVTYPHWAGYFGWVAVSAYLGVYFPLFVLFGRALVYGMKIPLLIAGPIAWVSVEIIRSYLFTGLSAAMLPHAMYQHPILIQTADIAGGYGVSFLILMVTVGLIEIAMALLEKKQFPWTRAIAIVAVFGLIFIYGAVQLAPPAANPKYPDTHLDVVLIQGSIDTEFPATEEEEITFYENQFRQYRELTIQARRQRSVNNGVEGPPLNCDLIVWPESIFPLIYYSTTADRSTWNDEQTKDLENVNLAPMSRVIQGAERLRDEPPSAVLFDDAIPVLTGINIYDPVRDEGFNSVVLMDEFGQVKGRYDKVHRVMFGEYFPFGEYIPFVYNLMPISEGLTAGSGPKAIVVVEKESKRELILAPSICFESTVGHLIRRQVNELNQSGQEPEALVNITNDGWFFGSNCLDIHLACNVFRSVELDKQTIIAANTGFSGHIDEAGRILKQGPRRDTAIIRATVRNPNAPEISQSLYRIIGDWPAVACEVVSLFAVLIWVRRRRKEHEE